MQVPAFSFSVQLRTNSAMLESSAHKGQYINDLFLPDFDGTGGGMLQSVAECPGISAD